MKLDGIKNVKFYSAHTNINRIYAEYTLNSADNKTKLRRLVELDSPDFASYLRLVVLPELDENATVKGIITEVKDHCSVFGNEDRTTVHIRSAGKLNEGLVEYALYNCEEQFVRITPEGYCIVNRSEHKFIKKSTNAEQIMPKKSSKSLFELLKPYVSASEDMFLLFVVWLVQSFCQGNHSALIVKADAGCGKSTLTKIIRKTLDPSMLEVSMLQGKTENLMTTLSNAYLVALDNMRELNAESSDMLCVAITGGTFAKREAYTTNQLAVFDLHNVLVMNGIDVMPSESDLAQRCLCLELNKIRSKKRVTDTEIENRFKADLPYILDRIFSAISNAMHLIHSINPAKQPRMLEAYKEMLAIALALGVDEADFETLYFNNIELINKMRTNDDLFFAIQEFMDNQKGRSFEGTVAKVYAAVRNNYSGNKSALPGSASQFSRKIKSEYAALLSAGFTVNIDDTYSDGTHIKIIKNQNV